MNSNQTPWLSVPHFPEAVRCLGRGAVQAIVCEDAPMRSRLAAVAVLGGLSSAPQVLVVTGPDRAQFTATLSAVGVDTTQYLASGTLKLRQQSPHIAERLLAVGAARLIQDLESNELATGSLIVLDHADSLFMLSDPRQAPHALARLTDWARNKGHIILALFDGSARQPRQAVTLGTLSGSMAGFARVRTVDDRSVLERSHWFDPRVGETTVLDSHTVWALSLEADSGVLTMPLSDPPAPVVTPLTYSETVLVVRGCHDTHDKLTVKGWQWADSLESLCDMAQHYRNATAVLPYDDTVSHEDLAKAITRLRGLGNPHLRIVVRERGRRLRMPMALAMIRLGASLIIPASTTDSGVRIQIAALAGTRFHRACETDLWRVLAESQDLLESNARNPEQFRSGVEHLLAMTGHFGLEHSLIRLFPKSGMHQVVQSQLQRHGRDLMMAVDGAQIWVFLFSCGRADVREFVDRLFDESVNTLLADWSVVCEPVRMLSALEGIRLAEDRPVAKRQLDEALLTPA